MSAVLKIHPELEAALDSLDAKEFAELKKSIQEEGVRDAIIVWDGYIVDGHNRYRIANELGKKFSIMRKDFTDISAAKLWMYRNQLGRRNLTPERREYFIGQLYLSSKQQQGGQETGSGQGERTSEAIAKQVGISGRSVQRAADFAKGVDAVAKAVGDKEKEKVLKGESELPTKEIREIGKLPAEKRDVSIKAMMDKLREEKTAQQQAAKEPPKQTYDVVFCQPLFDLDTPTEAPSLAKNATVYMKVDDAFLPNALRLFKQWDVEYQGTWVFRTEKREPGVYNHVEHSFLVYGVRGAPQGPKDAVLTGSMMGVYDNQKVQTMLEAYHPSVKKIDMRKFGQFKGWDSK